MNKITTERLHIRPPEFGDAIALYENYTQDPEVTKYLTWTPHKSFDDTRKFIDYCIENAETNSKIILILELKSDNKAVGMIDFDFEGHQAEFGYVLCRKCWNQGIMTEALVPVIEYVLKMDHIFRIWAVHDIDNPASGRVMKKIGMECEGILRRFSIHPNISDKPRDVVLYSVIK